jgi:uncharacterized protein with PhoU and TrkA domain
MTDAMDVSSSAVRVEFGAYCHPFTNPISLVEGGVMVEIRLALEVIRLRAEIATLTRERDEAVKRRREIDDEAFDYAEQIETLKNQLAAARELMAEAAMDIKYMVNAEYHGPDDVHPAMHAKYTRDMEIVSRLTAALTQEGA